MKNEFLINDLVFDYSRGEGVVIGIDNNILFTPVKVIFYSFPNEIIHYTTDGRLHPNCNIILHHNKYNIIDVNIELKAKNFINESYELIRKCECLKLRVAIGCTMEEYVDLKRLYRRYRNNK